MFMGEIRRYAAITELDETVLNRLINRILIGEPKKVEGVKTQEVRIAYNFVGELKKIRSYVCGYSADVASSNIRCSSFEISGKTIFFPRA